MAVFHYNRSEFFEKLPVHSMTLSAPAQIQSTGLGGGEILTAEVAPAVWRGDVTLRPMTRPAAAEISALLHELQIPGRSFLAYNPAQKWPFADPDGSGLNTSPKLKSHTATTMEIKQLPGAYELTVGDCLSFSFAPGQYRMHRLVESVTAPGGVTPVFTVHPEIRGTVPVDTEINFEKPFFRAVLVPGSVDHGTFRGKIVDGMSFSFRQAL